MPQTLTYQVAVGLRHGGSFRSVPLHISVPDHMERADLEKSVYEQVMAELVSVRGGGLFDMEVCEEFVMPADITWRCVLPGDPDPDTPLAGRFAINPEEIAWLQVAVTDLIPNTPTPPTEAGGV